MRTFVFIFGILVFVVSNIPVQRTNTSLALSPSVAIQGDLILDGNNVTTIEGRHDINGTMTILNNATMILKNAILNFTLRTPHQFDISLQNATCGNPRLISCYSTISAGTGIFLWENSTATLDNSTLSESTSIFLYGKSSLIASNHSKLWKASGFGESNINGSGSYLAYLDVWERHLTSLDDAEIRETALGGNGIVSAVDSKIHFAAVSDKANVWLLNSTVSSLQISGLAEVQVSWYLTVFVLDSVNQSITSANVTSYYPNATLLDRKLTDPYGMTTFALYEKTVNATGEYPFGNYTIQATFAAHSTNATVDMTANRQLTLTLGFIIPEFPSSLILPLFTTATLLVVILHKRKRASLQKSPPHV